MTPLTVIVVDDEMPARARLRFLLRADPRFVLAGEASDGLEALERIERLRPAIVILDVQMPALSGFEVLQALGEATDFAVVFSTAYEQYALAAFEAHAVDYLLKPYDEARFRIAMDKAVAQRVAGFTISSELVRKLAPAPESLVVKTVDGAWLTLPLAEVLRLSSANKYTCIVTEREQHLVRQPISELAARLAPAFVRIHRGEVVHLDAVRKAQPAGHGDSKLSLRDGSEVTLSRTYRAAFFEAWLARQR